MYNCFKIIIVVFNTLFIGPAAKELWEKLRRCFSNARNRQREEKKEWYGKKFMEI